MKSHLPVPAITELKPRIVVIGVGGAGGNAVNNMIASGLNDVEYVAANTDAQALAMSSAERRIQLGVHLTEGLGAGSRPEIGHAAAEEALDELRAHLQDAHMVFIAAGMGGGTGTGAATVVARAAREVGALTVGIVTKPFLFEGTRRMRTAEAGIAELQQAVDTLIVIPNQNLFRIATERTTFAEAFVLADQVLYSGVACIVDLIVKEGLINLDFADVRVVMSGMGTAMMGTGEASGEKRALRAAEEAIANPLLDDVSLGGAKGLLLSIMGGTDLTLYEVDEAASRVRQEVDPDANIIVGAACDESLGDRIRVSIVASGLVGQRATQPGASPAGAAAAGARPGQERVATFSAPPSPPPKSPVLSAQAHVSSPAPAMGAAMVSAAGAAPSPAFGAPVELAPAGAYAGPWQDGAAAGANAYAVPLPGRYDFAEPVHASPTGEAAIRGSTVQSAPSGGPPPLPTARASTDHERGGDFGMAEREADEFARALNEAIHAADNGGRPTPQAPAHGTAHAPAAAAPPRTWRAPGDVMIEEGGGDFGLTHPPHATARDAQPGSAGGYDREAWAHHQGDDPTAAFDASAPADVRRFDHAVPGIDAFPEIAQRDYHAKKGQPQHGQPHHGQDPHGQPPHGRAPHGQDRHGQPHYGQPHHGQFQPQGEPAQGYAPSLSPHDRSPASGTGMGAPATVAGRKPGLFGRIASFGRRDEVPSSDTQRYPQGGEHSVDPGVQSGRSGDGQATVNRKSTR